MKKLLFTLLCLPLIFSSCQEDDPTPSAAPPSSSALCGSATVTANGTNYTLNNSHMMPDGTCILLSQVLETNGAISHVAVSITNLYPNNWEVEWTLNVNFSTALFPSAPPLNIGTPCTSGFYANFGLDGSTGGPQYSSLSSPNGEMTITNIDNTNNTIDGNFSCTVYHIPTTGTTLAPQLISGSFSDIPLLP
jgi:hypothetical protein